MKLLNSALIISLMLLFGIQINAQDFSCLDNAPELETEEEFLSWVEENCPDVFEIINSGGEDFPDDVEGGEFDDPFACLEGAPDTDSEEELMDWAEENCPVAYEILFGEGGEWDDEEYPEDWEGGDFDDPFACLEGAPDTDSEEELMDWAEENCPEAYEILFGEYEGGEWEGGDYDDPFACLEGAPETETEEEFISWVEENCPGAYELIFAGGEFGEDDYPGIPCDSLDFGTGDPAWTDYLEENYPDDFIIDFDFEEGDIEGIILDNGVTVEIDGETIDLTIESGIDFINVLPGSVEEFIDENFGDITFIEADLIFTDEGTIIEIIIELLGKDVNQMRLTFDVSGNLLNQEEITASGLVAMEEILLGTRPNPADSHFILNFADVKDVSISAFSISGQKVYEMNNINTTEHRVDCSSWEAGLYILHYTADGKATTSKLSVQ